MQVRISTLKGRKNGKKVLESMSSWPINFTLLSNITEKHHEIKNEIKKFK